MNYSHAFLLEPVLGFLLPATLSFYVFTLVDCTLDPSFMFHYKLFCFSGLKSFAFPLFNERLVVTISQTSGSTRSCSEMVCQFFVCWYINLLLICCRSFLCLLPKCMKCNLRKFLDFTTLILFHFIA